MSEWNLKETLLDKEDVFNGTLLHVERWRAQLPNGAIATREMIRHVGASAIVPVDEEGNVYLVRPVPRAYRPGNAGTAGGQTGQQVGGIACKRPSANWRRKPACAPKNG